MSDLEGPPQGIPPAPSPPDPDQVTRALNRAEGGDHAALAELLPLVYAQLRAAAQQQLASERTGHTLQATALVHEAYLRLVGDRQIPWQGRAHFYVAAAEAMRRVLLDHAKARGRIKRGGNNPAQRHPINLEELASCENPDDLLAFDGAFGRLEGEDPDAAAVLRLRVFAGLSIDQTAEALDLSPRTVDRRWRFARAWVFRELGHEPGTNNQLGE